jgi:hypothetical protein
MKKAVRIAAIVASFIAILPLSFRVADPFFTFPFHKEWHHAVLLIWPDHVEARWFNDVSEVSPRPKDALYTFFVAPERATIVSWPNLSQQLLRPVALVYVLPGTLVGQIVGTFISGGVEAGYTLDASTNAFTTISYPGVSTHLLRASMMMALSSAATGTQRRQIKALSCKMVSTHLSRNISGRGAT